MQYTYENLNDQEFEALVIRLCKELFGIACKTFSPGKDGAKDSWFEGRAQNYPSQLKPWEGRIIIQAKHTTIVNASCSDREFSENASSILEKEIKRLNEIKKTNPFDCYIIFTNRKLGGIAHTKIISNLREKLGIQNVEIIGREELDKFLTDYPHIAEHFGFGNFDTPLRFYEKDLKDMIIYFHENRTEIGEDLSNYITKFESIDKEKKNELNKLSKEYFDFIKKSSIQYFEEIERFLKDPKNEKYTLMYGNTINDLQEAIIVERSRFDTFDQIMKHLVDYVVKRNEDNLKDRRNFVRVFIHFMYFNCDIGVIA